MAKRGSRGGRKKKQAVSQAMDAGRADTLRKDLLSALGFGGAGGWDAARRSERRGVVVWPTLDTSKELPRGSRLEILRKVRWADANVGLVRRAVGGLADMVGYQRPQAATPDAEWNTLAEEAVLRRWDNPSAFDLSGKLDAWDWQLALTRCRLRDGDNVTALGESSSGGAMMAFYESHQIDSGSKDAPGLVDGVFVGRGGYHLGYQLIGQGMDGQETLRRLKSRDVIYHADFERPGRVREVSSMAHAISNVVDLIEILADVKHGIKVAAQWGVVMTGGSGGGGNMNDTLAQFLNRQGVGKSSEGANVEIDVDQVLKGGRMQIVPDGADVKTLQDSRPHPNQLDLLRWLVRDIAWGAKVAPEVLWEQAGMGSAATRYLMAETRRWIENQQRIQRRASQRMWTYTLAREIRAGRVPEPKMDRWWMAKWIPQADMTIDRGRDGALEIQQIDKKLCTYQEAYAKRGKHWEDEFRQIAREQAVLDTLGLTPEQVAPA